MCDYGETEKGGGGGGGGGGRADKQRWETEMQRTI